MISAAVSAFGKGKPAQGNRVRMH